jgi:hypothetical protein
VVAKAIEEVDQADARGKKGEGQSEVEDVFHVRLLARHLRGAGVKTALGIDYRSRINYFISPGR